MLLLPERSDVLYNKLDDIQKVPLVSLFNWYTQVNIKEDRVRLRLID